MEFISNILGTSDLVDTSDPSNNNNNGDGPSNKNIEKATMYDIPRLLDEMVRGQEQDAIAAAKRLYELSDVAHKQNRVPLVCSSKYNVLAALITCLTHLDQDEKLHFVCLTLNNLSIPEENKKIMALDRGTRHLIGNLCQVIQHQKKETYLACICLMNLSYMEACSPAILQYCPPTTSANLSSPKNNNNNNNNNNTTTSTAAAILRHATSKNNSRVNRKKLKQQAALENSHSLLRILQDVVAHDESRGTLNFRWAFGLLSNLAKNLDNAMLIGQTAIPRVAVENLTTSQVHPLQWNHHSLEDFSLYLVLHLAESKCEALRSVNALPVVINIMQQTSDLDDDDNNDKKNATSSNVATLQHLKATLICAFLGAKYSDFPKYGVPAAAMVSELMSNTFDRVGKKGVYANNVFTLRTATKAYQDLAIAAANDDPDFESYARVLALPAAVALLFYIVADVVITSQEQEDENNNTNNNTTSTADYMADETAAEYAVGALMALLPGLCKGCDPPIDSPQTEIACTHLCQMLVNYTKRATSVPARARAQEVSDKMKKASTTKLPVLEAAYDLFIEYSTKR